MEPKEIIKMLSMQPHPEGGWYVQTFRDEQGGARGHSTAIYYLLEGGQRSRWHRVLDAAEVWHYYTGAPLSLHRSADGKVTETIVLGIDLAKGERPQGIIPTNWWQAAESLGDFTLVGCTVAPGFEYSSYELAAPDWEPTE